MAADPFRPAQDWFDIKFPGCRSNAVYVLVLLVIPLIVWLGVSMMRQGDTMGGLCLGGAVVLTFALAWDVIRTVRRRSRQPDESSAPGPANAGEIDKNDVPF